MWVRLPPAAPSTLDAPECHATPPEPTACIDERGRGRDYVYLLGVYLGDGMLTAGQADLVATFPEAFLAGLIHSDGCRCINRVKTYAYPRYFFSNRSSDIRSLFVDACTRIGVATRQNNRYDVSVARRDSVAILDRFIGPKA